MKVKWVGTKAGRYIRFFRVMWQRGIVGDGRGFSSMLSVGVYPRLFKFWREQMPEEWILFLCGLRVHYKRSYGGVQV